MSNANKSQICLACGTDPKYTDKKENQIFLIYREIENGADAKTYMTNGHLIYAQLWTSLYMRIIFFSFLSCTPTIVEKI